VILPEVAPVKPPPQPTNDWLSHGTGETKAEQNVRVDVARQNYIDADGEIRVITDPTQLHHIASDKSSIYTERFEEIFEKGGLSLQHPANLISIEGHKGAHGPAYHEAILTRLTDAVAEKAPYTPEYRSALVEALQEAKRDLCRDGRYGSDRSPLNDMVTGKK
jgi:hypothetical protein